jgi:iron uptake system component EfeO
MTYRFGVLCAFFLLTGCGPDPKKSDADFQREVVSQVQQDLFTEIQALHQAALELQAAAPSPTERGWNGSDEAEITSMKEAWKRVRTSWERSEGLLSALFPDLDQSMDARYEDFLTPDQLGPAGDSDPFDGTGITGMHAIERIVFLLDTPESVITREATFPGAMPAAWPSTEQEAAEFKQGLLGRLVSDSQSLVDRWAPEAIDLQSGFEGLTGLMNEQAEKVSLAGLRLDESRYSQRTMTERIVRPKR